jgi:uncharacterized protein YjiS (DUF1127 family)
MSAMQATHTLSAKSHRSLVDLIFSAWRALHKEVRIRRSMVEVSSMDEHMLRDLGLTRDDVERVVRHGR